MVVMPQSGTTLVSEKTPLLGRKKKKRQLLEADFVQTKQLVGGESKDGPNVKVETVMLRKHITLPHAIGMIIGGVAGSGIFISPTGVTASVQSVGSSLIIWVVSGMFNLILALCYAELGTALPVAGGDYAYLYRILGPLPAFLSLWTTVLLIGPTAGALMGRTVATYFFSIFGVQCSTELSVLMAVTVNVTVAVLNIYSVKWAARCLTGLSFAKLIALGIVIVTGLVTLAQGSTENFTDPWENSATSIDALIGGFLPGFASYVGWDAVNSLAEEMANPGRDLPLSLTISMFMVTTVYVLTNIAYFSVLSPIQFVGSDAVAVEFANRSLGNFAVVVPIFVALSAFGSAIGNFLAYPRYAFAGAREGQLPEICSYVSLRFFTPLPAIILIGISTLIFSSITSIDIQGLLDLTSIITQIKIVLALIALLKLKWKYNHIERTVKIPTALVVLCLLLLLVILTVAVIRSPLVNGMGFLMFLAGVPIYWAGNWCKTKSGVITIMDEFTCFMQRLFVVVPGGKN